MRISISVMLFVSLFSAKSFSKDQLFDDWKLDCDKNCVIKQGLSNPKKPGVVYGIEISKIIDSDSPIMQVNLPLGIYLPSGIGVIVGREKKEAPVITCLHSGCRAIVSLNKKLLSAMKKEKKLNLRFFTANKKSNEVYFSLKGFSQAINKL